jgi:hypothetical protein
MKLVIVTYAGVLKQFQLLGRDIGALNYSTGYRGTKLFNLIHDVQYVIRLTCRENHESMLRELFVSYQEIGTIYR